MGFDKRDKAKKYTLKDGDTLKSIAEAETAAGNKISVEEIARFNWGTEDPDTIDEFLRDELGCYKRGEDKHYVISEDAESRSDLLIPTRFTKTGLVTDKVHVIRVAKKAEPPKQFEGCMQISGITFEFDESFIRPSVVDDLKRLEEELGKHPEAKILIFGHTDKVGPDDYNQALSERRAKSVHAFITNKPEVWQDPDNATKGLYSEEDWGIKAVQAILKDMGGAYDPGPVDGIDGPKTKEAVKQFQGDNGLTVDGVAGRKTRHKLFSDYMAGKHDIVVDDSQFMDPKLIGCGEINPIVDTEKRCEDNRRVTFFLFNKDRLPRIVCKQGDLAPCNKQKSEPLPRHKDSFHCSFYDSIAKDCCGENSKKIPIAPVTPLIIVGESGKKEGLVAGGPSITAAYSVVVKKVHTNPERVPVTLKVDTEFDGSGEFTRSKDNIRFFNQSTNGDEINFGGVDNVFSGAELTKGVTLFAEGSKASDSVDDVELNLTLSGGTKQITSKATSKMTAVEVVLDICQPRDPAAGGGDPTVVAADKKINPGRFIHVQDKEPKPRADGEPAPVPADRLFHERAMIIVRAAKPGDWDGTLLLTSCDGEGKTTDSAKVEIFKEEVAAKSQVAENSPLEIPHKSGFKEVKCWVQGKTVSTKSGDSGLRLGIRGKGQSAGEQEGDRVTITVIKTDLVLCQSRSAKPSAADDYPLAMSLDDKQKKGRFVHVQFAEHHGRGGLLVKQIEPKDFSGKLELTVWDKDAKAKSTSKFEIFEEEVPVSGQIAKGNPHSFDHGAGFPEKGKAFWIQAKAVSGKLRDTEVRLSIPGQINLCDLAPITAVRFTDLKADIPSTPAQQIRNKRTGGTSNTPVPRHELIIAKNSNPADKDYDHDYGTNQPLVLIEGSVKDTDKIKLSVKVEPDAAKDFVFWHANRDLRTDAPKGDHATIIALPNNQEDPGLTQDAGDRLKAELTANAVGSFHIHPFIDCNGNTQFDFNDNQGKRIDREPYICMNLVLVRVEGVNNLTVTNDLAGVRHIQYQNQNLGPPWGNIPVPIRIRTGDFAGTGNDAIDMKVTSRVIGGGQDGKRGLDQVFSGWVNNELNCATSPDPGGMGEDVTGRHQRRIPAPPPPPPPPPILRTRCFWRMDGAEISGPMLDSGLDGGIANQGTGGNTVTGTSNNNFAINKSDDVSGIGQRWEVRNVDSPGGGVPRFHPNDGQASIRNFKFNIDFRADLVFWTNMNRTPGNQNFPACRLYSSVSTNTWSIRLESDFDDNFVETRITLKTINLTKDANATRRATPVNGSGLETQPPDGLDHLQADQPF